MSVSLPPDLSLDLVLLLAREVDRLVIAVGDKADLVTETVALFNVS